MTVDLSKLAFYSGANYMKREDRTTRYVDISASAFSTGQQVINHALGFVPEIYVDCDCLGDGMRWQGKRPWVGMEGSVSSPDPLVEYWVDENNLTLRVINPGGSTIVRRVFFVIYRDGS